MTFPQTHKVNGVIIVFSFTVLVQIILQIGVTVAAFHSNRKLQNW